MNAEYWAVGSSSPSPLPLAPADISNHLVADWVPSVPASISTALMGWPVHLLEADNSTGVDYHALGEDARRCERQWNGVLSWMLGVAGTRHVLESEGYRWVAPMSAFYPEAKQEVDTSKWHPSYPRSRVVARPNPAVRSRLRPDYIALRPASRGSTYGYEWAVVESKGTSRQLRNMASCPRAWRGQAENAVVECSGVEVPVPRRLVVATRSNPSAVRLPTRRLVIRAWNAEIDEPTPLDIRVEVVAAHLFGVCRNLGLRENAIALALATDTRRRFADGPRPRALQERLDYAAEELGEARATSGERVLTRDIQSSFGLVEVRLEAPTVRLIERLRSETDPEGAATAIDEADAELGQRLLSERAPETGLVARSSAGLTVTLPPRLLER